MVQYAASFLTGDALNWWLSRRNSLTTWSGFRAALLLCFSHECPTQEDKIQTFYAEVGKGQLKSTTRSYVLRLQFLAQEAGISDKRAIKAIRESLKPFLAKQFLPSNNYDSSTMKLAGTNLFQSLIR